MVILKSRFQCVGCRLQSHDLVDGVLTAFDLAILIPVHVGVRLARGHTLILSILHAVSMDTTTTTVVQVDASSTIHQLLLRQNRQNTARFRRISLNCRDR
jgi:hypothetical protein